MIHLSDEQKRAVEIVLDAVRGNEHCTILGLAGTGKTTVAAFIARLLSSTILAAPTNKAAAVFSAKTGREARTVHSIFHQPPEEKKVNGEIVLSFQPALPPGSLKGKTLLLDECSMVRGDVARDVLATGITIIAFGDHGQLPPVGGSIFFDRPSFTLTEIHRQALENPIIRQAHAVRVGGGFQADGDEVQVVDRYTIALLRDADIVLVGRKKSRGRFNQIAREAREIFSPWPLSGEPVICERTVRRHGLYSGAVYTLARDFLPSDTKALISTDFGNVEVHARFLPPGHEYDNPNILQGGWMTALTFGYALTAHKSMGSEWASVLLLDESSAFPEIARQWRYTGITRASERIVIARGSL